MTVEAIRNRRSIRKYEEKDVTDEQVSEVLEAARLAPSWKNLQTWRFIVVRDKETRAQIADTLVGNPSQKAVVTAPVLIVVCADPEESGVIDDRLYYLVDIGIVMDHIMLEAADMGLGTVFVGLFDEGSIKPILGVPDKYRIVALPPRGYPARHPDPRPRKDLSDMLHKEKW